jgi:hypothetical protein
MKYLSRGILIRAQEPSEFMHLSRAISANLTHCQRRLFLDGFSNPHCLAHAVCWDPLLPLAGGG